MGKVGILTQGFPFSGEWFLIEEAKALEAEYGSNLTWFPRAPGTIPMVSGESNVQSHSAKFIKKLVTGIVYFPLRPFLFEVVVLFKTRKLSGLLPLGLAALDAGARLAQLLRAPRCDVYYSYWSSVDGLVAVLAAKRRSSTSVVRSHGSDFYPKESGVPRPFVSYLHSKKGAASVHVYLSKKARTFAKATFGEVPSVVLPLGIKLSPLPSPQTPPETNSLPTQILVSASSAASVKRLRLVARVFEKLEETGHVQSWQHFGLEPGDFYSSVGEHLRSHPQVVCRGLLENDAFCKELGKLKNSFFVNLSSSEGLPVTLLEAGAVGIPIVATDVGNVSDLVDSQTGLLVQPDLTDEEIAEAVRAWLQTSELIGQASRMRKRVEENYNNASINPEVVGLLNRLMTDH